MLNLNDREWKEFFIKDLFSIISGKDVVLDNNYGNVPFINSSGINNGVTQFVDNYRVKVKNCITIARTGTVGSAFYQKEEVAISGNIRALIPIDFTLNKFIAHFIIVALKNNINGRYDYGKILGTERLLKIKILLPANKNGNPDYEFMEQYVKEQESRKREEYIKYIKNELHNIEYKEIKKWEELEWKPYKINDIFSVSGTTTTAPSDLIPNGKTPRITCSSVNNALDNIYQNAATEKGGVLTIDSATIGSITYQEADFIATDHVEKLTLRDRKMNKYIGLFFVSAISSAISQKYDYGYKFSQFRIKRQIISLPVNSFGAPDYEYMEQYIKNNIYLRYIQYLIEREIENSNYKIARLYTEGYGIVTSILPADNSLEEFVRYVFDLKKQELKITLDFDNSYNINSYLANILSKEIINAINTKAIKLKFRTSNSDEMNEFSEGYTYRTNLIISYLEKYKIDVPKNHNDIWE